jgi:hypothetical protein
MNIFRDWRKRVLSIWANHDRLIGFLRRPKLSFNYDRRSTSRFKILSSSQKVNSFPWTCEFFRWF